MKQSIYTVRDKLAHNIGSLCLFENDDVAERAFRQTVNSGKDPMLQRCSSDFEMVRLGDIDTSTGEITPTMVLVAGAFEVLNRETQGKVANLD